MDYRGTFRGGVIRPDSPVRMPDGTTVEFRALGNGRVSVRRTRGVSALERNDRRARRGVTLAALAREQKVRAVRSVEDMAMPGLEGEDVDEFLRSVREGRR